MAIQGRIYKNPLPLLPEKGKYQPMSFGRKVIEIGKRKKKRKRKNTKDLG
jgi:hypothetical protein